MPKEVMSCADSCNVGPDNDDIMNCHCDCWLGMMGAESV